MKKISLDKSKELLEKNYHNIFEVAKILYSDVKTRSLTGAAILLNIFTWAGSIFINFRVNEDVIALHHNIYFGITLIGSPEQVYFIPLLGLLIILINLILSYIIQHKNNFFVYLFAAASIAISFFLLLGIGSIMLINFR